MTFEKLIENYFAGEQEGTSTIGTQPGHLRIEGNKLIHYNTTIVERTGDGFILNRTKYSIQTGKLENRVAKMMETYQVAKHVPRDYSGSLVPYIETSDQKR